MQRVHVWVQSHPCSNPTCPREAPRLLLLGMLPDKTLQPCRGIFHLLKGLWIERGHPPQLPMQHVQEKWHLSCPVAATLAAGNPELPCCREPNKFGGSGGLCHVSDTSEMWLYRRRSWVDQDGPDRKQGPRSGTTHRARVNRARDSVTASWPDTAPLAAPGSLLAAGLLLQPRRSRACLQPPQAAASGSSYQTLLSDACEGHFQGKPNHHLGVLL